MRPRTRSITCGNEYFGQPRRHNTAASTHNEDQDDWMTIALAGSAGLHSSSSSRSASTYTARRLRAAYRSDSADSLDSNCSSWMNEDEDEEDDELLERTRTCSHDRRISFQDEVNVVTIPSRDSFDEEDKRRMWYSSEEFHVMRHTGFGY